MTTLLKIIVTSLLSLLLFSCNVNFSIDGKGTVTTEEHNLQEFNQVNVSNGWELILIKGSQPKMTVEANENLHQNLEFSVDNNILDITSKKNIGHADAKTIKVYYVGNLWKIAGHSGAEIDSDEIFEQNKIEINASSGADISLKIDTQTTVADASSGAEIELTGNTENLESSASSGSGIDAENLKAISAVADASSGAEIDLNVAENFTAEASSGGNIEYSGNPKNTKIDNSISGDIQKKN